MTFEADASPRLWATAVGFLYLLMAAVGSIPMLVGRVPMPNDAAAAAAAILTHPSQVHTAFAANLFVVVCYLPVPALLYKLFKPVNGMLSLIAAFFGLAGCAVQGFACLFRIAPLVVLTSGQSSSGIDQRQVQALAYLLLKLYTPAYNISLVFFAVAMVFIGWLVFKSTFMPRLIGILAMISGIGWLVFLWPPLAAALWPRVILPLDAGELALVLWLLIAGVNVERWHEQAGRSSSGESAAESTASRAARLMWLSAVVLVAHAATAAEVTKAARWELHSSFWMNLHQTLMRDAMAATPRDTGALSAEERAAWDTAVAAYRKAGGTGNITFSQPMSALQDELSQIADDAVNPEVSGPLFEVIRKAAPIYRAHWWPADDASNRFFIGYASAMLRDAGEELVRAHEAACRGQMPKSIRVDITGYADPFGGYSQPLRNAGYVITMSSREAGYQGLSALEMMLHESLHSIVDPTPGTVIGKAIIDASAKHGVRPPRDLWHAILFATSSELTRRALLARGVTVFKPSVDDMFARVWPKYRTPIETHWYPYLSGSGTLEEAIDNVVAALNPSK